MQKKLITIIMAAAISGSLLSGAGAAEKKKEVISEKPAEKVTEKAEKKEEPQKLVVGGQLRLRSENMFHYDPFTPAASNNDANILLRARINLDANPVEHVRVFVQPQFSRVFGQENNSIANNNTLVTGNTSNTAFNVANDVFDLHQGYIDLTKIGGSDFSLRLGRQELSYGDERLVGSLDWSNIGRSFDAGKIRFEKEKYWIDGFASYNERAGGKEIFSGLYGSHKPRENLTYDLYAFLLNDNDNDGVGTVTGTTLGTFGTRLVGTALESKQLDYSLEGAIQAGKTKPNTHLAFMGHAAAGYTFDQAIKPRVGVEYNFASGDKASTTKVERFHNLFPTNHNKYGYIDFVGLRNIHDITPSLTIKPGKSTIELSYHLFLLPQVTDGLYQANGTLLRAGAAGVSRLAGHEADLLVKYPFNKNFSTLAGYSLFKGGKFFSDTGANGTAHFLYLQGVANF